MRYIFRNYIYAYVYINIHKVHAYIIICYKTQYSNNQSDLL